MNDQVRLRGGDSQIPRSVPAQVPHGPLVQIVRLVHLDRPQFVCMPIFTTTRAPVHQLLSWPLFGHTLILRVCANAGFATLCPYAISSAVRRLMFSLVCQGFSSFSICWSLLLDIY